MIPLNSFMQDLLRVSPDLSLQQDPEILIVVDTARVAFRKDCQFSTSCQNQQPLQFPSERKINRKLIASKQRSTPDAAMNRNNKPIRRKRPQSGKSDLDVSDHTKKETRWEPTIMTNDKMQLPRSSPLGNATCDRLSPVPRRTSFESIIEEPWQDASTRLSIGCVL